MDSSLKDFKSMVENSSKILLVFPSFINADACASIGLLYRLLTEHYKKKVDIASSRGIPERYSEILKKSHIIEQNILPEIDPVSYVINIAEALKDSVDVKWNRKDDGLKIILTPEGEEIDFNKITFEREGGIYDLVITLNISRLEDLGRVYTKSEKQFAKYNILTFNYRTRSITGINFSIVDRDASTTSEVIKNLYDGVEVALDQETAELVLHGIIGTSGLNGHYKNNINTLRTVTQLAQKYDIDINAIISKYFNSLTKEEIRLYERMFRNLNFDEGRGVIYSFLTSNDFSQTGTNPSQLDGLYSLPFNLNQNIDLAFLVYQRGETFDAIFQSNNTAFDMPGLLKRLNGYGDRLHGIAQIDGTLDEVIRQIVDPITTRGKALMNTSLRSSEPVKKNEEQKEGNKGTSSPKSAEQKKEMGAIEIPKQKTENEKDLPQEQKGSQSPIVQHGPVRDEGNPLADHAKDLQISKETKKEEEKPDTMDPAQQTSAASVRDNSNDIAQRPIQASPPQEVQPQIVQQPAVVPAQPANKPVQEQIPQQPRANEIPDSPQIAPSSAPQQKSPFIKAQEFILDPAAEPLKKAPTFSAQNKPFDPTEDNK